MSGPVHDPAGEFFQIASLLSAFLTSDRDHRFLLPDVFEMLLRNLELEALLYYTAAEGPSGRVLRLEHQLWHEEGRTLPRYEIPLSCGLTGGVAITQTSCRHAPLAADDLRDEPQLTVFAGRTVSVQPVLGREKLIGVVLFAGGAAAPQVPESFFQLVINILSSYFILLESRQDVLRTKRKLTLLNSYRRVFNGSFEIQSVLSAFMNLTANVLGAEVGICVLLNRDSTTPWLEVNWGISWQDLGKLTDAAGRRILEELLASRTVVRRCSATPGADLYVSDRERGSMINSILAGNLYSKEERIGLIIFANKDRMTVDSPVPCFDEQDEELFGIVVEHARVFVENYLLYGKVIEINDLNRKIVESIDSGVLTLDLFGGILSCNERSLQLTGKSREELLGQNIHAVLPVPGLEPAGFLDYHAAEIPLELPDFEYERGGLPCVISVILSPMRGEAGRTSGFVLTIQDRTEHVVMERHIRRADKLAALGELSAGLAHEIKNPLTAIKGFSQLVPERLSDSEFMGKFSRMLGNELMRIDELTERLLAFARPNVGDMRVLAVADLVEDAVLLAKYQLEKAGIIHELETCTPVPEVRGSPGRISQVFLNIIINSLHAMEQGGRLLVRISRRFYRIPERGGIRAVLIDFTDTGCGIAPEDIDRVFNPFFTTRESGTGLGLAISYRIIEEHGGVMEVRSLVGEGTRMRVVLPEVADGDA